MPYRPLTDDDLLRRMRSEYLESPGLHITAAQAGRLWQLDVSTCHRLLRRLVGSGFLLESIDGRFRRVPDGDRLIQVRPW